MEEEIWKDYPKFPGEIQVSSSGRIASVRSGNRIVLRQRKSKPKNKYWIVSITANRSVRPYYVSRMVAETFLENPDKKPCVDHIDGNPDNNCVNNLRWCTYLENNRNPITRRRMSASGRKKVLTEKHKERVSAALKGKYLGRDNWNSKAVMQFTIGGELVREWYGVAAICRETGYSLSSIYACLEGRSKYSHGYLWKYKK